MLGKHLLHKSGPSIPVGEKWTFTSNGSWTAPANGNYKITLVGAGGKGGNGGQTYTRQYRWHSTYKCQYIGGGGGGGGGAGETLNVEKNLLRNAVLTIIIGAPNGRASTITGGITLTARGGGNGGNGGNGSYDSDNETPKRGSGGAAASVNYGNGISAGAASTYATAACNTQDKEKYYRTTHGSGGAGAVSKYGNGYGRGGTGSSVSSGAGSNGTAGICVIEYLGK